MEAFFEETNQSLDNITKTYDMIWPIAVGLWNLRCSVNGVKSQATELTESQLAAKFSEGSGIRGVNFKRSCMDKTWEEEKQEFAWILLNSTIPVFEGWLETLHIKFSILDVKRMQFPSSIMSELRKVPQSTLMTNTFYSKYASKSKRNIAGLQNMMYCYRVFKEMRNCYMHNGGLTDRKLMDAYNDYTPVSNPIDLGVKVSPIIIPPILGSPIQIDLHGVVGMSDVLIRIMLTIDTELVKSAVAQTEFEKRFRASKNYGRTLKSDKSAADNQVKRYITQLSLPIPMNLDDVRKHLQAVGYLR